MHIISPIIVTIITRIIVAKFNGNPKPRMILNIAYNPIKNNGNPMIKESKDALLHALKKRKSGE